MPKTCYVRLTSYYRVPTELGPYTCNSINKKDSVTNDIFFHLCNKINITVQNPKTTIPPPKKKIKGKEMGMVDEHKLTNKKQYMYLIFFFKGSITIEDPSPILDIFLTSDSIKNILYQLLQI